MMRCEKCGNKVADGKKFCVICGAPIENPQIYIDNNENNKKSGSGIGVKILLFTLGILIIAGLVFFVKEYVIDENSKNETNQINTIIV